MRCTCTNEVILTLHKYEMTDLSAKKGLACVEHVSDEWQVCICCRKWCHDFTIIRLDLACECWYRARHARLRDEGHQAKHRQAAIVDLDIELVGFLLLREALLQAKWVEQIEWNRVWDLLERWKITRLASA